MASGVKVLLLKGVEHLGHRGQIVEVNDGYARNFLFPRKLAAVATPGTTAWAERLKAVEAKRQAEERKELEALGAKLATVSVTLTRKAHDDEKLFGSVTSADIADALASQGLAVDRKKIHLPDHLKSLGVFTVPVRLATGLEAPIKVWIVREAEKAG